MCAYARASRILESAPMAATPPADAPPAERAEAGYHALEERTVDAREQVQRLNEQAIALIQEKPAVAIGVALGVGYLLGAFASRRWIV